MTTQPDRPRIFSHITRSRFLHVEDALEIAKIRLFIGAYQRGKGAQSTAYHFLDLDDARPLTADMAWNRPTDFVDYKGTAGDHPTSRVLKVKGPKDGKFWLEIQNGPGEIVGEGAIKPKGAAEAKVSISIPMTIWENRKLALAIQEYLLAYRVKTMISSRPQAKRDPEEDAYLRSLRPPTTAPTSAGDIEDLFGAPDPKLGAPDPKLSPSPSPTPPTTTHTTEEAAAISKYNSDAAPGQKLVDQAHPKVKAAFDRPPTTPAPPPDDSPTTFYSLAPIAIKAGLLDLVNELASSSGLWSEKAAKLQAALG